MEQSKRKKLETQEVRSAPTYISSLDLSTLPPSEVSILNESYEKIYSSYSLNEGSVVEFNIPPMEDTYLDLSSSKVYFRMKVVDANNNKLSTTSKTAVGNCILSTLFSSLEILVNNVPICTGTGNYPYAAFIHRVLNWNEDSVKRLGPFERYYKETKDTATNANNEAYKSLKLLAQKESFEVIGSFSHPLFLQKRLIPPGTSIRIRMRVGSNIFYLLGATPTNAAFTDVIKITEGYIDVKKVIVSSEIASRHQAILARNGRLSIPMFNHEVITYSITQGTQNHISENLLPFLPPLVVIGLVNSAHFNGKPENSPFQFNNYTLQSCSLLLNGESLMFPGGHTISTTKNEYFRVLHNLLTLKGSTSGQLPFILEDDFASNGLHLIPLWWSSSSTEDRYKIEKTGQLKIHLSFSSPLAQNTTVVVYYINPQVLSISKDHIFIE